MAQKHPLSVQDLCVLLYVSSAYIKNIFRMGSAGGLGVHNHVSSPLSLELPKFSKQKQKFFASGRSLVPGARGS